MIIIKSDKKNCKKFGYLKKKYYLCSRFEKQTKANGTKRKKIIA